MASENHTEAVDSIVQEFGLSDWIEIKLSGERKGGQGSVTKVMRKRDNVLGALKVMHEDQQWVQLKRNRMSREVAALKRVGGNGVPAVLEDNISEVDSDKARLFFISEWVEGKSLQERYFNNPTDLDDALQLVRNLSLIVDRCHAEQVLHRDIKPENIIIKSDGSIHLVDFGLAWSESSTGFNSASHEEMSNSFLRLDELITGHQKHDKVSDVTYLVGILFFLITGRFPKSLTDGNGNPPHTVWKEFIPTVIIGDERWSNVKRIFDVGFQSSMNHRFKTAIDLIQMVDRVNETQDANSPNYEDSKAIRELNERLKSTSFVKTEQLLGELEKINDEMQTSLRAIARGSNLSGGANVSKGSNKRSFNFYFSNTNYSLTRVALNHRIEFNDDNGTMLKASFQIDDLDREVYYEGYSADIAGLKESVSQTVPRIFSIVAERYLKVTVPK